MTNDIFFTRNGLFIDYAFGNVADVLYPAVGLGGPGEVVLINTGQLPFLWNFDVATMETAIFRGKLLFFLLSCLSSDICVAPPASRGQVCTFHPDAVRPKESKTFVRTFEQVASTISDQGLVTKPKNEVCATCVVTPLPSKDTRRLVSSDESRERRKRSMTSTDKTAVSKGTFPDGKVPLSSIDI